MRRPVRAGQPVLLPLTESLYVSGALESVDTVLLEIGTGYFVEVRQRASSCCLISHSYQPLQSAVEAWRMSACCPALCMVSMAAPLAGARPACSAPPVAHSGPCLLCLMCRRAAPAAGRGGGRGLLPPQGAACERQTGAAEPAGERGRLLIGLLAAGPGMRRCAVLCCAMPPPSKWLCHAAQACSPAPGRTEPPRPRSRLPADEAAAGGAGASGCLAGAAHGRAAGGGAAGGGRASGSGAGQVKDQRTRWRELTTKHLPCRELYTKRMQQNTSWNG